jgi:hypothetical protein
MKYLKPILRLFLLTHLYFWHGINFILFADREVTNFTHYVDNLKNDRGTEAFQDYLENQLDRSFKTEVKSTETEKD